MVTSRLFWLLLFFMNRTHPRKPPVMTSDSTKKSEAGMPESLMALPPPLLFFVAAEAITEMALRGVNCS